MKSAEIAEVCLVVAGVVAGYTTGWMNGVGEPEPVSVGTIIMSGLGVVALLLTATVVDKQDINI